MGNDFFDSTALHRGYLLLKAEYLVSPPIETQIKTLLYQTKREERITKTELAKCLQVPNSYNQYAVF